MQQLPDHSETPQQQSSANTVHALMHFWRVVRYRKNVVITSVVVSLLLGGLYFSTTTKYYKSKASLLVLQTNADRDSTEMQSQGGSQGLMPTFQNLFKSAEVLDRVAEYLPPENRLDFKGVPRDRWINVLRDNLSASIIRRTNIIEVSYRSREPATAKAIVDAVLDSYQDLMKKNHQNTSAEVLKVLEKDKRNVDKELKEKEVKLFRALESGAAGLRMEGKFSHPTIIEAMRFNDLLMEAQKNRLDLEALMGTIDAAVQNGEDLQQYVLSMDDNVGKQLLMNVLGIGPRHAEIRAGLEQKLLVDQAELSALQRHFGPNHPRVVEINSRIKLAVHFLSNHKGNLGRKLSELRDEKLGPMLKSMLQQRLDTAWRYENLVRASFEKAQVKASALSGNLARLEMLERDVKRLGDQSAALSNRIANIDVRQNYGDVRTRVVTEPVVSNVPVWPTLHVVGLLSLMTGLTVGFASVYVLDVLDDRFRSPEEMQLQLGMPVLAMVRRMENLAPCGLGSLQIHAAPDAIESEAFRTLRTALAFGDQEAARIVVSSAEPGDGKTTILANLGVAFANSGKKTLLIDADLRRPGLTRMFEMKGTIGLSNLLRSDQDLVEAAAANIQPSGIDGLDILPSGARPANPAEMITSARFSDLLGWAESAYDQILIDSPPTLATVEASVIGRLVDGAILVVQPEKNQRRMVIRAADGFATLGTKLLGVVINHVEPEKGLDYYGYGGYGYGYGYGGGEAEGTVEEDLMSEADRTVPRRVA